VLGRVLGKTESPTLRRGFSIAIDELWLELEAQAELHDARGMGMIQNQKARGGAGWIPAAIIGSSDAAHVCGRTGTGGIDVSADRTQLGVVEDVEVFPAEFEGVAFLEGEALEQAEVKVEAAREREVVAGHRAESETGGKTEGGWIVIKNAEDALRGDFVALCWVTAFALPTISGKDAMVSPLTPLATPALSLKAVPFATVKGEPERAVVIPEICQPPRSVCAVRQT